MLLSSICLLLAVFFLTLSMVSENAYSAGTGLQVTVEAPQDGAAANATLTIFEKVVTWGDISYKIVAEVSLRGDPVTLSRANVTPGKEYLAMVSGYVPLGINRRYYSYLYPFTAPGTPAKLEIDDTDAVRLEARIRPAERSDYSYHGFVQAYPHDSQTEKTFYELATGVSEVNSSGWMMYSPDLQKGTYVFATTGNRYSLISGPQTIENHFDEVEFNDIEVCSVTFSAENHDQDSTNHEMKQIRFVPFFKPNMADSTIGYGRIEMGQNFLITPGEYSFMVKYIDRNDYAFNFYEEEARQFTKEMPVHIHAGYDLKVEADLDSQTVTPGGEFRGEFSIFDGGGLRLINVYHVDYNYPPWSPTLWQDEFVKPRITLFDRHNNPVVTAEQSTGRVYDTKDGEYDRSFSLQIPHSTPPGEYTLDIRIDCGAAGEVFKQYEVTVEPPSQGFEFRVENTGPENTSGDEKPYLHWNLFKAEPEEGVLYELVDYGFGPAYSCHINTKGLEHGDDAVFLAIISVKDDQAAFFARPVNAYTQGELIFDYEAAQTIDISVFADRLSGIPLKDFPVRVQPLIAGGKGVSGFMPYLDNTDEEGRLSVKGDVNGVDYRIIARGPASDERPAYYIFSDWFATAQTEVKLNKAESFSVTSSPEVPLGYNIDYHEVNLPLIKEAPDKPAIRHYTGVRVTEDYPRVIASPGEYAPRFSYQVEVGSDRFIYSFNHEAKDFTAGQEYILKSGRNFRVDSPQYRRTAAPGETVLFTYIVTDQFNNQLVKAWYHDHRYRLFEKYPEISISQNGRVIHTAEGDYCKAAVELPGDMPAGEYDIRFLLSATEEGPLTAYSTLTVEGDETTPQPGIKYGDVTGDGNISVSDAIAVLRHIVNIAAIPEDRLVNADVDGDGAINVNDAILILRHIVGLIDKFPVELG